MAKNGNLVVVLRCGSQLLQLQIAEKKEKRKGTPAVGLTDLDSRIESNIRKLRTEVIRIW